MPIYTYSCTACGYRSEQLRSHTRRNRKQLCARCNRGSLKREIGTPDGLLTSSSVTRETPIDVSRSSHANQDVPNVIFKDCEMDGPGRGIYAENIYLHIDGLRITETTPAFGSGKGVRLEMKGVSQDVGPKSKSRKPKNSRPSRSGASS